MINHPDYISLLEKAIQSENPEVVLENLVRQLSSQGFTRSQNY
jgi:pyruvate/2-oxoglutarate/acetoin dehydrogenase E1 component